jgi:hypothetical protein
MDYNIKYVLKLKDNTGYAAGAIVKTTDIDGNFGGVYSFSFTIPLKPKIGSILNLHGDLSSGGYFNVNVGSGMWTANGQALMDHPGGSDQDEPFPAMDINCHFTQADEMGATLQCDPVEDFLEKDGVVLKINRK